jgi:predicted ATPase/class 3 adenylate cyclase
MAALPSGPVALLFTDIEGSTRLWERYPLTMGEALARHDALVRGAIEQHNGVVFKTVGDAFCATFVDPRQALAASIAVQLALVAEPWGETGPIRVRMAIHAGEPSIRGNDYFGPPVNCVARLLAAGHGGQILISDVVKEMLAAPLDLDVACQDMGLHRLRDVQRPIRIFQLVIPGLPSSFPTLKTLDYDPHNLPAEVTSFVGRHGEVAEIHDRLRQADIRLLTLTGPGGVGKTRIALHVAAAAREEFPDGRYLVSLAALRDPSLVPGAMSGALGLQATGSQNPFDLVFDHLRDKQLLLVLDNFEHLRAARDLLPALLLGCPRLKILVTSRVGLRLYGEYEYAVPPFALPDLRHRLTPGQIAQNDAVALFLDRARSVKPGFGLMAGNASIVAEICVRLDGLPLAIELAAVRSRLLSPAALLRRLSERLAFLDGDLRGLPARQQTIRATIQWSHDLLTSAEQALFRRLAIFAGGFTIDAAARVLEHLGEPALDLLDGLESLIHNSLIQQRETADGEPRLFMLETIREFALDCCRTAHELSALHREHAAWCLEFAAEARTAYTRPDEAEWLDRLDAEHDNLRAALTCLGKREDRSPVAQIELAAQLWWFWLYRGHSTEGRTWLAQALAAPGAAPLPVRADALNGAGVLAFMQADNREAEILLGESLRLRREQDDTFALAGVLNNLANVARVQGKHEPAAGFYEEAISVLRRGGQQRALGTMLSNLGLSTAALGDYERATAAHEEALTIQRTQGHQRGVATSLGNLADVAAALGDFDRAASLYDEAAATYRNLHDQRSGAETLLQLANVACLQHDLVRASAYLDEVLPVFVEAGAWGSVASTQLVQAKVALRRGDLGDAAQLLLEALPAFLKQEDSEGLVAGVEHLAALAVAVGEFDRAARLLGASQALRDRERMVVPPAERAALDATIAAASLGLGDQRFAATMQEGARLSPAECAEEARLLSRTFIALPAPTPPGAPSPSARLRSAAPDQLPRT